MLSVCGDLGTTRDNPSTHMGNVLASVGTRSKRLIQSASLPKKSIGTPLASIWGVAREWLGYYARHCPKNVGCGNAMKTAKNRNFQFGTCIVNTSFSNLYYVFLNSQFRFYKLFQEMYFLIFKLYNLEILRQQFCGTC